MSTTPPKSPGLPLYPRTSIISKTCHHLSCHLMTSWHYTVLVLSLCHCSPTRQNVMFLTLCYSLSSACVPDQKSADGTLLVCFHCWSLLLHNLSLNVLGLYPSSVLPLGFPCSLTSHVYVGENLYYLSGHMWGAKKKKCLHQTSLYSLLSLISPIIPLPNLI